MGVCIGQTTIYDAVNSLSDNAADGIRDLGQTLLAAYAYDNFDVDLKQSVPIIEKSNQSLKHLTSGLLFPLQHGATKEDLACSDYLWQRSKLNSKNSQTATGMKTYRDLPQLFFEPHDAVFIFLWQKAAKVTTSTDGFGDTVEKNNESRRRWATRLPVSKQEFKIEKTIAGIAKWSNSNADIRAIDRALRKK